jgi:hypothetical protein
LLVLVEGRSDRSAVRVAAERCGVDLERAGVEVLAMGGVTNLPRFLREHGRPGVALAGLYDAGEAGLVARSLERAGVAARGFFACDRDLEDELIRAVGPARVVELIEREGELGSLRTLQQMPFHRSRSLVEQLHRFIGCRSGRKDRYASLLVGDLAPDALPRPLTDLLTHASAASA